MKDLTKVNALHYANLGPSRVPCRACCAAVVGALLSEFGVDAGLSAVDRRELTLTEKREQRGAEMSEDAAPLA